MMQKIGSTYALLVVLAACQNAGDGGSGFVGERRQEGSIKGTAAEISYSPPPGIFLGSSPSVQNGLDYLFEDTGALHESIDGLHARTIQEQCAALGGVLHTDLTNMALKQTGPGPYKVETYCVKALDLVVSPNPLLMPLGDLTGLVFITNHGLPVTLGDVTCASGSCGSFAVSGCGGAQLGFMSSCRMSITLVECQPPTPEAVFAIQPAGSDVTLQITVKSSNFCIE